MFDTFPCVVCFCYYRVNVYTIDPYTYISFEGMHKETEIRLYYVAQVNNLPVFKYTSFGSDRVIQNSFKESDF